LKRLSGPDPLIVRDIWLLVLPELRRNPAIRRVLDWIIAVAEQDAEALRGTATDGQSPGTSSDRG
jgi:DNA-binding transcriptional LysR family regulator